MRHPAATRKPRQATLASFPVPTAGLISNRNIALPMGQGQPPGAAMLTNWFPTPSSVVLRKGLRRHADVGAPIISLFSYTSGAAHELFAATEDEIFNVTTSTPASVLDEQTSGDWITLKFSTAGGNFLIGVNGSDPAWVYDGVSFEPLIITGVDTANLSYVWAYKQRVWFIEKDGLNAWYLPVDQYQGKAEKFPLGGIFGKGGSLLWGQTWSLDSSGEGGLSEQCVFTTTEGEVAAYQGISPEDAATWDKVGVYNIGRPLGRDAFIRAGGDLVVATSLGFIPLGQAIRTDYAALGLISVANPIADEWRKAINVRGGDGWRCEMWGEGAMTLVAPPTPPNQEPIVFVANSDSGAWALFTGWNPTQMEASAGNLYFGTADGYVQQAWVGGSDDGAPYVATMMPLFNDLGSPGQRKSSGFARVATRSALPVWPQVEGRFDWDMSIPAPDDAVIVESDSLWDAGIWDVDRWDQETGVVVVGGDWVSVGGSGYAPSVLVQVTSGSAVPLDVEIVRIDYSYTTSDIVT